jgi:hypothetical protein
MREVCEGNVCRMSRFDQIMDAWMTLLGTAISGALARSSDEVSRGNAKL